MIRAGRSRHLCGALPLEGDTCLPRKSDRHYLKPGVMTTPGSYQPLFADLPRGIADLAKVAQGLLIHEFLTGSTG